MGISGPVPKRESERVRRNKNDVPTDSIPVIGPVDVPPLGIDNPHPIVADLYDSLKDSGQSRFYEPSDWQYARFTMKMIDDSLKMRGEITAVKLQVINQMLGSMLMTEGERRRARIEIERDSGTEAEVIQAADLFMARFARPA